LTPNALYEIVSKLRMSLRYCDDTALSRLMLKDEGKRIGMKMYCPVAIVYTDEDKCNEEGNSFFQPNIKYDFNLDYLLSNNYICHFCVYRNDIIRELRLRQKYDGAQDYDLLLRAIDYLMRKKVKYGLPMPNGEKPKEKTAPLWQFGDDYVLHIPKVLYHWRSYSQSTSSNPLSKKYAYDAGKRAVIDFLNDRSIDCKVTDLPHVGFYRINYGDKPGDIFKYRPDVGAIGGKIVDDTGTLIGGAMDESGNVLYEGLKKHYSGGFLHRGVLQQNVSALDIRSLYIRKELKDTLEANVDMNFDVSKMNADEIKSKSIEISRVINDAGYRMVWDPMIVFNIPNTEDEK